MTSETLGCIYAIDCFDTDDLYIGSTTHFIKRKSSHKRTSLNKNEKRHNQKVYQKIREYGGWDNWVMFVVEDEIPIEKLKEREQFYIDTLEPSLNEYDAICNLQKRAEKKLEKIQCECGLFITNCSIARHRKTKKHKKLMENEL